ncbi:hypothetical protein GE09DRAFT_1099271 [Coniochaeta sp. 2T2.1]|nr:hypothetical protein GE09DRAFT_1099271 [Coniochaeta sp. 2T2.1]
MAQAELLSMPQTGKAGSLTAQELHEIQECAKLVRFRDEVLSGNHPRIKPAHLVAKTVSADSRSSSNALTSASSFSPPQVPAFHSTVPQAGAAGSCQTAVNSQKAAHSKAPASQATAQSSSVNTSQAVPGLGNLPSGGKAMPSSTRPFAPSGSTEINPVLLEKSVDLVRAERHLKRQRLERSLKEEADERRLSTKATLPPSEVLPQFDVADVLSKAQALVKPDTDDTVANASAASDSFDDNTFYSSQHDTPEFLEEETRGPNKSPEDVEMREESPYEPRLDSEPVAQAVPEATIPRHPEPTIPLQNNIPPPNIPTGPRAERMSGIETRQNMPPRIPGLQTVQGFDGRSSQQTAAPTSYPAESSGSGAQKTVNQPQLSSVNSAPLGEASSRQPSPVIRAHHNLSPIAPQPAHVSPLAVARQPAVVQMDEVVRTGTPAQVAALRKQPSAASSPDSSPRDNSAAEKKQKKKKKRKSERMAAENAPTSPYIKPEPRSPSPIVAPSYPRPNKRLRQEQSQPGGQGNNEVRYEQPPRADDPYTPRYEQRRTYVDDRYPHSQQPQLGEDLRHRQAPPTIIDTRYDREYYEPARPSPAGVYHRPASPGSAFLGHYTPGQVRQVRSVSHAVLERPGYREAAIPIQYATPREGRMSVRPAVDRERSRSPIAYERHASAMPPPRAPVRRIIVDEYGREYIEPPRPAVVRASVAPGARLDEPEVIYERTVPARAMSRRPDVYEDVSPYGQLSAYPPASAPYARRVVTQPELGGPDYRAYRERDYVPRQVIRHPDEMLPPGAVEVSREYVRAASVRPAGDGYQYDLPAGYQRRIVEEVPREYASVRAGSVRPVEGQRYEVHHHGYERVGGEYAGAVPARTASVRPGEPVQYGEVVREQPGWARVGSVRPEAREYAQPEASRREMLPPALPQRAYSVRPGEAPMAGEVRQEYQQPASRNAPEGYYAQPAPVRGDEEVTYVGQGPRQGPYPGEPRRH